MLVQMEALSRFNKNDGVGVAKISAVYSRKLVILPNFCCINRTQASCECRSNCTDSATYEVTDPEP